TLPGHLRLRVERVTGIEPASPAWKAGALPLSYTRAGAHATGSVVTGCCSVSAREAARDRGTTRFVHGGSTCNPTESGVGEGGFEPPTACPQSRCATTAPLPVRFSVRRALGSRVTYRQPESLNEQ